jgi:glucan phosphoethanolaminetransferase (alkaline phosphatase superfamily)
MQKETNVSHGLKWGTIIGAVYCVFLFLRYNQGNGDPLMFGLWTFIGYVTVLILLLICGVQRKKKMGGYIDLKNAFQTMFVAVLGFEFIYMAFNFIYLKFIDPQFFENFRVSMEAMLEKANVSQDEINDRLKNFDKDAAKNMNLGSSLTTFAFSIMVSGIFALLFALIIKKKKNPFQHTSETV